MFNAGLLSRRLKRRTGGLTLALTVVLAAPLSGVAPVHAKAGARFTFLTDWHAQAEHGGFYQAQAMGLYDKAGLAVTLKMGGPQVNLMQLLVAGKADCIMGFDVQTMKAWEQGVQAVTVAAFAQKDPVVIIAHPDIRRLEDLRGRPILVGQAGQVTYWPWLQARYGYSDAQRRPYTFNIQPFLADRKLAQQGYLTSEPYSIEQATGVAPSVFLLADQGWPPYATTVVCLADTIARKPAQIAAFVRASAEGWKQYLQGNPAPANALIMKDNPNMRADVLAQAIQKMKSSGVVMGGDAAKLGIGVVTAARMQRTFEMLVQYKLLDPGKVDWRRTYTDRFVTAQPVLP